ncbi:hypothetical protein [Bifidobacterium cuniculi]|uniref:Ethanolamine utilization protein EutL n=1 Tax=Bifidobacterium cuniculi TaxID=1688 RepID=A0A087B2M5_9BIFI|nr:hypothetical protein [Bifidobacterium cuniculi]KFI65275.1 hypothetical protein BCUN_1041 [Bifidobacterium cuniculi]
MANQNNSNLNNFTNDEQPTETMAPATKRIETTAQPTGAQGYERPYVFAQEAGRNAGQQYAQQAEQPQYAAPEPPAGDGATAATRVHDKLSNKMIAFVVGISLACGLAAGVAGTAIANAVNGSNDRTHSWHMAEGDSDSRPSLPEDMQGQLGQDGSDADGEMGFGDMDFDDMGGRGGMRGKRGMIAPDQQAPQDGEQSDGDDTTDKDSSGSDKDSSDTATSSFLAL